jgi:hypothetical protein
MKWMYALAAIGCTVLAVAAIMTPSAGFFGFFMKLASILVLAFAALIAYVGITQQNAHPVATLVVIAVIAAPGIWLWSTTPRAASSEMAATNSTDDIPVPHIEIEPPSNPHPPEPDTVNVGHVLGHWITPLPPSSSQFLTIRERDGVYESVLQLLHSNNPIVSKLKPRHSSRGRRFDDIADVAGTYYILLKNGDLDIWDKDGEFLVARRYEGPTDRASREKAMSALWDWAACRNDASCEGEKYRPDFLEVCPDIIERQARYEVRWTNHIFEGRFLPIVQWHGKNGRQQGLVDFEGDKVQFQNGFGAWQNYYYICTFDIVKKQIVDLKLKPGHLLYRMQ